MNEETIPVMSAIRLRSLVALAVSGGLAVLPATAGAQQSNPFAAPADAGQPAANPFGGGASNPFGSQEAPQESAGEQSANPFGSASSSPPASGASNPFGSGSPFGGDSNPFGQVGATTPAETASMGGAEGAVPGITQLYEWRYDEVQLWNGEEVVSRIELTKEQAEQWDERRIDQFVRQIERGDLAGYNPSSTVPPREWAEWALYADQLELWSRYINNVVFAGLPNTDGDERELAWDAIIWPGVPRSNDEDDNLPGGIEGLVAQNQNKSLDSQLGEFFGGGGTGGAGGPAGGGPAFGGGGFPGAGGPYDGQNQSNIPGMPPSGYFSPELVELQVVLAYNQVESELRLMEENQQQFMVEFMNRLDNRENRRLAYDDWVLDQQLQLEEFLVEWDRQYRGDVALIGGVRYELYSPDSVPERLRRDATVVVTDFRLTPYDILNPDGTLREPTRN